MAGSSATAQDFSRLANQQQVEAEFKTSILVFNGAINVGTLRGSSDSLQLWCLRKIENDNLNKDGEPSRQILFTTCPLPGYTGIYRTGTKEEFKYENMFLHAGLFRYFKTNGRRYKAGDNRGEPNGDMLHRAALALYEGLGTGDIVPKTYSVDPTDGFAWLQAEPTARGALAAKAKRDVERMRTGERIPGFLAYSVEEIAHKIDYYPEAQVGLVKQSAREHSAHPSRDDPNQSDGTAAAHTTTSETNTTTSPSRRPSEQQIETAELPQHANRAAGALSDGNLDPQPAPTPTAPPLQGPAAESSAPQSPASTICRACRDAQEGQHCVGRGGCCKAGTSQGIPCTNHDSRIHC